MVVNGNTVLPFSRPEVFRKSTTRMPGNGSSLKPGTVVGVGVAAAAGDGVSPGVGVNVGVGTGVSVGVGVNVGTGVGVFFVS